MVAMQGVNEEERSHGERHEALGEESLLLRSHYALRAMFTELLALYGGRVRDGGL
jgi:hypothetical protein